MVSEIKGAGSTLISALDQQTNQVQKNESATSTQAVSEAGVVEITATAEQLQQLERAVAAVPEVDSALVAKYRQAIADGSYTADASATADRFLEFEANLKSSERS